MMTFILTVSITFGYALVAIIICGRSLVYVTCDLLSSFSKHDGVISLCEVGEQLQILLTKLSNKAVTSNQ